VKLYGWIEQNNRYAAAFATRTGDVVRAHEGEAFHAPEGAHCNVVERAELLKTDNVDTKVA
jgi:hypothetical protein